jgi:hypothetical protein
MADKPDAPSQGPGIKIATASSEQAPFVYFDGVACMGTYNGAIQLELAANTLMPDGASVRVDVLQTAHLRCSPAAAADLRNAIDKALEMLQQGAKQVAAAPMPGSKPN